MPIFLEYAQSIEATLVAEKINQSLNKVKKGAEHSQQSFREKEDEKLKKHTATYVTDVTIDENGTLKTWFNDEKFPITGYADIQSVWVVAGYKRLLPLIVKNISRMGWIKRVITALGVLFSAKIVADWLGLIFEMNKVLLKDEYYSPCVKEIRRVLKGKMDERLLDGLTGIIEYDVAYRYPVQDILSILDKEAFVKNWRKELKRLFEILISRSSPEDSSKFKNIYKLLPIYLIFNRKLLKGIKDFVKEVNLEKMKPSENDYYWMCYLATYNCFGLSVEEREEIRIKMNGEQT